MKILTASQTREADAYTIKNEPISSIDLMERASTAFVKIFLKKINKKNRVKIFCGTGNNGGDGLAISRLLMENGYNTGTYVIKSGSNNTDDFKINYNRLTQISPIEEITSPESIPQISSDDVLIDGIFGSGLTRPVSGLYGHVIDTINQSNARIISIDIASGLYADTPYVEGSVIKPWLTITFQMPKLAFFIPENEPFTGDWIVTDIGLHKEFINSCETPYNLVDNNMIREIPNQRRKFAHKGDFGRVALIAGSYGKMGAAILASRACLKTGAGLLTAHIPKVGYEIMQSSVPEAMTTIDSGFEYLEGFPDLSIYDTLAFGPGLGTHPDTKKMVGKLLDSWQKPAIIDADGLNILSQNRKYLKLLKPGSILTPHLKEFERIVGECSNHFERFDKQKDLSSQLGIIIALKGAYTSISMPDGSIYFNNTGNPGMATGGSGDVLTGILAGIMAQKYSSENTALMGVYLHGLAGDIAAGNMGQESVIASDITEYLPQAYEKIMS
ncbi:NAD(P)H-hydrate dehydratase [Bacteroidota bacterium]